MKHLFNEPVPKQQITSHTVKLVRNENDGDLELLVNDTPAVWFKSNGEMHVGRCPVFEEVGLKLIIHK